jgi:hypothetical protein
MSIQHVDPAKVEAVLRYLAQNFSNHTMTTFPDPDHPHQQAYHIHWKGDGSAAHRFAVGMEFFSETDVQNIATKLTAFALAQALHTVGREKLVVTARGMHRL